MKPVEFAEANLTLTAGEEIIPMCGREKDGVFVHCFEPRDDAELLEFMRAGRLWVALDTRHFPPRLLLTPYKDDALEAA